MYKLILWLQQCNTIENLSRQHLKNGKYRNEEIRFSLLISAWLQLIIWCLMSTIFKMTPQCHTLSWCIISVNAYFLRDETWYVGCSGWLFSLSFLLLKIPGWPPWHRNFRLVYLQKIDTWLWYSRNWCTNSYHFMVIAFILNFCLNTPVWKNGTNYGIASASVRQH